MPGVQGNMLHMLKYILINMIKSCIAIFFSRYAIFKLSFYPPKKFVIPLPCPEP